jgi:hypothetical protein
VRGLGARRFTPLPRPKSGTFLILSPDFVPLVIENLPPSDSNEAVVYILIDGDDPIMRKLVGLIVLLGLLSLPVMAADTPKAEVFGGYQYLHSGTIHVSGEDIPDSSQGFNGWDANATYYFNNHLGVQGDFSGSYATFDFFGLGNASGHVYTYSGGPVVALNAGGKVNPFVHALFGGIRLSGSQSGVSVSESGFTTMVGGGVDVKVAPRIAFRLIQVDWVYYHFGDKTIAEVALPSFSQSNNVRIATGIVFRF